jgi:hypothetical protein
VVCRGDDILVEEAVGRVHCLPRGVAPQGGSHFDAALSALERKLCSTTNPAVLGVGPTVHTVGNVTYFIYHYPTPALEDRLRLASPRSSMRWVRREQAQLTGEDRTLMQQLRTGDVKAVGRARRGTRGMLRNPSSRMCSHDSTSRSRPGWASSSPPLASQV